MVKNPSANAGDTEDVGSIPGLGRSPGGGNGNPLQYFCLRNLMDRGVWQATVHGVARAGHDLNTKPPPLPPGKLMSYTQGNKHRRKVAPKMTYRQAIQLRRISKGHKATKPETFVFLQRCTTHLIIQPHP